MIAKTWRLTPAALLLGCLALTSACGRQKPHSLKETKVPTGFTFKTSHSVSVTIAASAAAVSPAGSRIELTRADGKVLFRGRINPGHPLHLKLPMATKETQLTATLQTPKGLSKMVLPINGATASASFL